MIRIKLESKGNSIIFKLKLEDKYRENIILKRVLLESKALKKGRYNYEVPLRFFLPIVNNFKKEKIIFDKYSIESYFEFSDCYDEAYYVAMKATPQFMKKWREEGCPVIYKISINKEKKQVKKEIVFKRPVITIER